jgi:hypothetical protein
MPAHFLAVINFARHCSAPSRRVIYTRIDKVKTNIRSTCPVGMFACLISSLTKIWRKKESAINFDFLTLRG